MGGGYVNKQPKTTKFETLNKKSIYKKLALLFVAVFLVASVYFKTSSAKYKVTQEVPINSENINLNNLNTVAVFMQNEEGTYDKVENNLIPTGNYELDLENTKCTVDGDKVEGIEFRYENGKVGVYGIKEGKTKCNFYFKKKKLPTDAIKDQVIADKRPNTSISSCLNGTDSETHDSDNCSEETNGVYAQKTSLGTTYYYRGTVNNNWVKFGKANEEIWVGYYSIYTSLTKAYKSYDECNSATSYNKKCTKIQAMDDDIWWRIIRINEDGTVRLIYAGIGTKDNVASSDTVAGVKGYWMNDIDGINGTSYQFNTSDDQNAYVGYMYGTPGSDNYDAEHENIHDSNAKIEIDKWYETNLQDDVMTSDEVNVLSGRTGFCGDRSLAIGYEGKGYGQELTYYKANNRISMPSYECPNSRHDLYTTRSDPGEGNGALTYPIGLITADEVSYAGGTSDCYGHWLYTGKTYITITPMEFESTANIKKKSVGLQWGSVIGKSGLKPVVNLKSEYLQSGGDGTIDNPYIASAS